jgi:hypothetical protein
MSISLLLKPILAKDKIVNCILFACIPAGLFYLISLFVLSGAGFSIMEILRDPAQQSGQSSFLGFLSNIGIWLWISSVAICFFSFLTGKFGLKSKHKELLLLVGLLALLLAVDDFFMIHDRYVNQRICYLTYAMLAGALLLRHYKQIIEVDGLAFLLAGSLLALSIFIDLVQGYIPLRYAYVQVVEEGCKFVGAATWLYFSFQVASTAQQLPKT